MSDDHAKIGMLMKIEKNGGEPKNNFQEKNGFQNQQMIFLWQVKNLTKNSAYRSLKKTTEPI